MNRNSGSKKKRTLQLEVLPQRLAVCRLEPGSPVPDWASAAFAAVTRTSEELSVVCPQDAVPADVRCQRGLRALKVVGPLDFNLTGILSSLVLPLAEAEIPLFAISTYDTDYLLVAECHLEEALCQLRRAEHAILEETKAKPASGES